MYGAKYMLVGLLLGIGVGASSNIVQRHVRSMCNCSKQLITNANKKMQECNKTLRETDLDSIKKVFTDKLEQLKSLLDEINSSLTQGEVQQKVNEVKEKVETLFKEVKHSFNI